MHTPRSFLALSFVVVSACASCGSPAQQAGIGRECEVDDDCNQGADDDTSDDQQCLAFKGGYCGREDCSDDDDCPGGSACVAHDDGASYCFLLCRDKSECNGDRSAENESNCSSNIAFTNPQDDGIKACVPPSA